MAEMNVIIVLMHILLVRSPDCELAREMSVNNHQVGAPFIGNPLVE